MKWSRTILDGIVMCVIFNAVVGMFFFVFPQAYHHAQLRTFNVRTDRDP
ncbi:MAG: hypothetical protein IJ170_01590 [Ruminococcus sp.]|nr:hypothetical protein [Ruminococcus sp.]